MLARYPHLRAFVNPNYDGIKPWIDVCYERCRDYGGLSALLLPVRSDRDWWERALKGELNYIRGRMEFVPPPRVKASTNAFESVLVVFDPWTLGCGVARMIDQQGNRVYQTERRFP
jgi:hypothetical protein